MYNTTLQASYMHTLASTSATLQCVHTENLFTVYSFIHLYIVVSLGLDKLYLLLKVQSTYIYMYNIHVHVVHVHFVYYVQLLRERTSIEYIH